MYILGQVSQQDFLGILAEVFLECFGQVQHRLARTELGALHHTLLIEHEQVRTARQYVTALLRLHAWRSVLAYVVKETTYQLKQVPEI